MVSVPPPFVGHRVAGIDGEIDDDLLELAGIGPDRPEAAAVLDDQIDSLAEQPLQQMRYLRHHVGKLEHLRAQGLLPREGKKLSRQPGSAVRVRLDLLDVVIVAVARRMPHQHEVAMADDCGQDVVEIVRDPAGELADDLHLGRLRDLALELGFLAIVLEQQQDRGVAEATQAGDGQRDGLGRLAGEPDRKVARHGRPAGVAPDRIGDGGLVFLDHQVARIDRQ